MKRILIKAPIWHSRSIGIAEHKISLGGGVEVEIVYKDKNGVQVYPNVYEITMREAIEYPRQEAQRGVTLRIIPIADLRVKEER